PPPHLPAACAPGPLQGPGEPKAAGCTPANAAHSPPRRSPAPARAGRRPSPLTHAGAASSQQSPQGSVSGREPTAHCASLTRLAAFRPRRLIAEPPNSFATRPSFVTRYRPPAPTPHTPPSPINRRTNRLKFFPLAPTGSPPSPSISSTSPHCSSVSRGTGTNGPTGNNRIRAGLIPHPSASHGAAQHAAPQ